MVLENDESDDDTPDTESMPMAKATSSQISPRLRPPEEQKPKPPRLEPLTSNKLTSPPSATDLRGDNQDFPDHMQAVSLGIHDGLLYAKELKMKELQMVAMNHSSLSPE